MGGKKLVVAGKKSEKPAQLMVSKPDATALAQTADKLFNNAFTSLAAVLSTELAPQQLAPIFLMLKQTEDTLKDLHENARTRMLAVILHDGKQVTDTGTRRLEVADWVLEARPQRTGVDARKLETMLRAKNIPVEQYMMAEVTFKLDEDGLHQLIAKQLITPDELETCKHELKFNVQRPKRAREEE